VNVRLNKVIFSSEKNSRGQLILASSGGKAILSPSRGYTKSTPSGGGSFKPIKLPARVEKAQAVLKKQWDAGLISHKRGRENTYGSDQAYRVAWRNILDWVQAQMALLEIGMAKMEEVFLPYMQDRQGVTFYERMEKQNFLLESGNAWSPIEDF
jgi:hypothetical protein